MTVNPVTAPTGMQDAVHVKPVPVTSEVRGRLKVAPVQTGDGWLLVRWGVGLTVTVRLVGVPSQPLAWGVIRYVTVAGEAVVFVSTSLIPVTLMGWLAVKPVTAPTGRQVAVQVKAAPVTSEVRGRLKVAPEHIGEGWLLVRWGVGLTVTVRLVGVPLHPLAWGVIR